MKKLVLLSSAIMVICLALPTWAVDLTGKIGVGVLGSAIKPVLSDSADVWPLGGQGKLLIKYGINKNFAVGLSGGYARVWNDTTLTGGDGAGFAFPSPSDAASAVWDHIPIELMGFYSIIPDHPMINPFLTLGVGVDLWKWKDYDTGDVLEVPNKDDEPVDASFTELTASAGGGVEIFPTENLGINLGGKFTYLTGVGVDISDDVDRSQGLVEGFAGLVYYFEMAKDSDGDGIKDNEDACPLQPEDYDGYEDEDGCPDPDNDNDGVPDVSDNCPNEAEDLDGYEDEDGCPDPDNDNDGIPDRRDNCPNEPEDIDGDMDEDGCPDMDADGDGVMDDMDRCPDTPMGIAVDMYGCPKAKKIEAKEIVTNVQFESGSDKLTPSSMDALNQLFERLMAYPDVKLKIAGYTDSVGSRTGNQKLSQKRAEAVMNYLIGKGISSQRLQAIGMGEADPIASNDTSEGRAKNRRVEIEPMK